MGGMAPASRYHTGVKSMDSYVRGQPTNHWASCWIRTCCEHSSHSMSRSLKIETAVCDHISHSMSSLLKNETNVYEHSFHPVSSSLKNEPGTCEHSSYSVSSSLKNEIDA